MPRASTHCSTKKWILYQTATDLSVNKQYITSDKTCIMIREAKNHVISKGVIYRFYWLCSLIPAGCRGTLLHMHARGKSHLLDDLIRCCWSYSCKNLQEDELTNCHSKKSGGCNNALTTAYSRCPSPKVFETLGRAIAAQLCSYWITRKISPRCLTQIQFRTVGRVVVGELV